MSSSSNVSILIIHWFMSSLSHAVQHIPVLYSSVMFILSTYMAHWNQGYPYSCVKWIYILLLFNEFTIKLDSCLFEHLSIFRYAKCLLFGNNHIFNFFVKSFFKLFILFLKLLFGEVKHGLDWSFKDTLSRGRNGGGSSIWFNNIT